MTREVERGGPASWRVPAHDLEQLVIGRLCRHLAELHIAHDHDTIGERDDASLLARSQATTLADAPALDQAALIANMISRIDIHRDRLELILHGETAEQSTTLIATGTLVRSGRQTRLVPPGVQRDRPGQADEGLIRLVANAHAARLALMNAGERPISQVAAEQGFTQHYFSQLARLGSLAPDIVTAILEGRQPAGLTRTRLAKTKALPIDWFQQRRMFGFA